MIKKLHIASFITLALLFSACSNIEPKQESTYSPPAWVTEPPQDTPNNMWGVGSGSDLENAKRSALKDIASRLRVAISAQTQSSITVTDDTVDKYARTQVAEDVQRTEFKNYSVEKSALAGQEFYALVKVDRQAFISNAKQQLATAENEMAKQLAISDHANNLDQFIAQQKALPWIEKAVAASSLLSAVDANFDSKKVSQLEATRANAKAATQMLILDLKSDKDNNDIALTLRNYLNDTGIRTGKGGSALLIKATTNKDVIFGSNTVQLKINFSIMDAHGRSLTSKEFTAYGASMTDHHMARLAALNNLSEKLREAGVLSALGFYKAENN
jgi:hypothetical protein